MKRFLHSLVLVPAFAGLLSVQGYGQEFNNFIRQIQLPGGTEWNVEVSPEGTEPSPLAIDPGGARFELHTVRADPFEGFLLDTTYVSTYTPVAEVVIRSEDPHTPIPRTRADRPFAAEIRVSGLLNGTDDPESSKSVEVFHHVQSYGTDGDGIDIDRSLATMIGHGKLAENGLTTLAFLVTRVPGADRAKVRGEERFSVYSLEDSQAPASELDSQYIQIWPVADGSITGITDGEEIRFSSPQITLTVNDIYPDARVYAQVYPGLPVLGTEGTVVPGSAKSYNESVPQSMVETLKQWDKILTQDGTWTMELLTETPFGIDRLDYVTFDVNRTIEVNGGVTTIE
jgi:hypothetical protein